MELKEIKQRVEELYAIVTEMYERIEEVKREEVLNILKELSILRFFLADKRFHEPPVQVHLGGKKFVNPVQLKVYLENRMEVEHLRKKLGALHEMVQIILQMLKFSKNK